MGAELLSVELGLQERRPSRGHLRGSCVCVCACVHACVRVCMRVCVCVFMCVCACVCACVCSCVCVRVCVCVCVCVHVCVCWHSKLKLWLVFLYIFQMISHSTSNVRRSCHAHVMCQTCRRTANCWHSMYGCTIVMSCSFPTDLGVCG